MLHSHYKVPEIEGHSNIEIQISNGCNLTCQSCSHYTNTGGGKNLDLDTVVNWILKWNYRIVPKNFIIMGGEPTINKQLVDITKYSLKLWQKSNIKIITNGWFLKNHPDLPSLMHNNRIFLEISLKSESSDYLKLVEPIKKLINEWTNKYSINVHWRQDYKNWLKIYDGYGPNIKPFQDNDFKKSYKICGQKVCRVLHDFCLWKCPRLAYLKIHKEKFGLDNAWDAYLNYKPLRPEAKMREVKRFFQEEEIYECSMCPAQQHHMNLPSPLISVKDLISKNE